MIRRPRLARLLPLLLLLPLAPSCGGAPGPRARPPPAPLAPPPRAIPRAAIPRIPPPAVVAESAIVVDYVTGRVLYARNAALPRPVASPQKIVTALTVLDAGPLDRTGGIEASGKSSRTTHGHPLAVDACRFFGGLILGALAGAPKEDLLSARYAPVLGYWQDHPLSGEIDRVAAGSYLHREPPEIRGRGYVVDALEAALWAFSRSRTFEEGCLLAVNLGDDADTTGAIYGQLAGAYYGTATIPAPWLACLARRDLIESYAGELMRYGTGSPRQ
jgi:hypothetical protein